MAENNIDCFNKATLFILSYLYDRFPDKIDFHVHSLWTTEIIEESGSLWIDDGEEDPTAEGGSLYFLGYLTNTIIWLQEENFLRYSKYSPADKFEGVVLSNKGLMLLGKPSSLSPTETLVDSIKAEFKKGASSGIQKLGQQLIQSGVSRFLVNEGNEF